jgi:hypothetical protein
LDVSVPAHLDGPRRVCGWVLGCVVGGWTRALPACM